MLKELGIHHLFQYIIKKYLASSNLSFFSLKSRLKQKVKSSTSCDFLALKLLQILSFISHLRIVKSRLLIFVLNFIKTRAKSFSPELSHKLIKFCLLLLFKNIFYYGSNSTLLTAFMEDLLILFRFSSVRWPIAASLEIYL